MLSESELKQLRPLDVANLAVQLAIQATQPPENCMDQAITLISLARKRINATIGGQRPAPAQPPVQP